LAEFSNSKTEKIAETLLFTRDGSLMASHRVTEEKSAKMGQPTSDSSDLVSRMEMDSRSIRKMTARMRRKKFSRGRRVSLHSVFTILRLTERTNKYYNSKIDLNLRIFFVT